MATRADTKAHYEMVEANKYYGKHATGWVLLRNGSVMLHGNKKDVQRLYDEHSGDKKTVEGRMATRADLEKKHGASTKAITEKAIGITQAIRKMYGGVHAAAVKPHTDVISMKARQLYNETHAENWTTNDVPSAPLDKMKIRAQIDELQRDIRNTEIPIGLARIMANRLLDALRGLRQAIDNI